MADLASAARLSWNDGDRRERRLRHARQVERGGWSQPNAFASSAILVAPTSMPSWAKPVSQETVNSSSISTAARLPCEVVQDLVGSVRQDKTGGDREVLGRQRRACGRRRPPT